MSQNNDFEMLLVKDKGEYYEVSGTTYSNALLQETNYEVLKATIRTIDICKKELQNGNRILISKNHEFPEVQPHELIVSKLCSLDAKKQLAINSISNKIHQLLISASVIDVIEYMNSYMQLLSYGIFITDENRDDMYFKIIDDAQSAEMPKEPGVDATFEQQEEFFKKKSEYDNCQKRMQILEKYLNSYDKIIDLKRNNDMLVDAKSKILAAQSEEQLQKMLNDFDLALRITEFVKC